MKNTFLPILLALLVLSHANGHGTPIHVDVISGQLIASHPLIPNDFSPPVFGEADDEGSFSSVLSLPGLGSVILWQLPGLDIFGMDSTSNLSIEVLARPVVDSDSSEQRVLWYWNPENEAVEPSPAEFHLLGTGMRSLTLQPDAQTSPLPFLLANPVAGQTGFHNHSLLLYGLDNDNIAPAGVYGFFARLTSNSYAASDPFLLVFNYVTDYELMIPASNSIYTAGTLPGDYDLDNDVDGRDFLVWQRLFGSTTRTVADASLNGVVDVVDLTIWQENYRAVFGGETLRSAVQVPEPAGIAVFLVLAIAFVTACRSTQLR